MSEERQGDEAVEKALRHVLGKPSLFGALVVVTLLSVGQSVTAQPTVIATIGVGNQPGGVAVNPTTNLIYVVNEESGGSLSVIDGATNTIVTTVDVASKPRFVTVNPSTNRIYVTHYFGKIVTVIDGANNTIITTVPLGATNPTGVGANPNTNRIYVASVADSSQGGVSQGVSVIDGTPGSATEHSVIVPFISVGNSPSGVGVNPITNRIYVTNSGGTGFPVGDTVSVIDGDTNMIVATVTVGEFPASVGVIPTTNRIYVSNVADDTVSVIDGNTNMVIATVTVGVAPFSLGVNPATNRIYVANSNDRTMSIINGADNAVVATVSLGGSTGIVGAADGLGVNPTTSRIYVSHQQENFVSVIEDLAAVNHFQCYVAGGDPVNVIVDLEDQFGVEPEVLVGEPSFFCNPVDKNGEGISFPTAHLTCYILGEVAEKREVTVENQFGLQTLELKDPELFCVPSEKIED